MAERQGRGTVCLEEFLEKKKATNLATRGFEEPDTRQQLLPLLSFEPDGVGSAVAVRLLHQEREYREKAFSLSTSDIGLFWESACCEVEQLCRICTVLLYLRIAQAGKRLQALHFL